jgi:hypothetical protein
VQQLTQFSRLELLSFAPDFTSSLLRHIQTIQLGLKRRLKVNMLFVAMCYIWVMAMRTQSFMMSLRVVWYILGGTSLTLKMQEYAAVKMFKVIPYYTMSHSEHFIVLCLFIVIGNIGVRFWQPTEFQSHNWKGLKHSAVEPKNQTPWPESASELPTGRPPFVGEVNANFCG